MYMGEIKPFVKWAWWKRGLLPQLIKYFPEEKEFDTYIEPFLWGWAVLIYILQNYKVENVYAFDINQNLINCYKIIKSDVKWLIEILSTYQSEFWAIEEIENQKKYYDWIKDKYNSLILREWKTNVERAAQFIFLNKTCFNGLYRENRRWEFNVPFWKLSSKPTICDKKNLRALSWLIQEVNFFHWNYKDCKKFVTRESFVYFDPPYRPITKQWFTSYVKESFNDDSQKELARFYNKLHTKNKWIKLMLSNSNPKNLDPNDTFFEELYNKFEIKEVFAKRFINSKWNGRWAISELLITNY